MPSRRQRCGTAWVRPSVVRSLTSPPAVAWCRSAIRRSWPRCRASAPPAARSQSGSLRPMSPSAACVFKWWRGEVVVTLTSLPRLVATDLDGTLLRRDGMCSGRTRAALAAVEHAGIQVVLVTARPPRWLHDLADLVGEHGVVLCANGAFVYDVRSRRILHEDCLPVGVVMEIAVDLRNALPGIAFAVESRSGFGRERGFQDEYTTSQDVAAAMLEELLDPLPGKMLARCNDVPAAQFHRVVEEVVGDRAVVSYSGASGLAEMSAVGVTKASAVSYTHL